MIWVITTIIATVGWLFTMWLLNRSIKLTDQILADLRKAADEYTDVVSLVDKLADILTRTAIALKGEPPDLTRHDWSDLPDMAQELSDTLHNTLFCNECALGTPTVCSDCVFERTRTQAVEVCKEVVNDMECRLSEVHDKLPSHGAEECVSAVSSMLPKKE